MFNIEDLRAAGVTLPALQDELRVIRKYFRLFQKCKTPQTREARINRVSRYKACKRDIKTFLRHAEEYQENGAC